MLLSVIVPNYNHGHFLEERLTSILRQLGDDGEIVVVDDASTDNSLEVIARVAAADLRVKLVRHAQNLGVAGAMNAAVKAAAGRYIIPFAGDDIVLPGFVEESMRVLLAHPEIPICCSDPGEFHHDEPDKIYTRSLLEGVREACVWTPEALIRVFQTTGFYIPGHTVVVKREALLRFGGYNEHLGAVCDWFVHHAIALHEGVAYVPRTLALWRVHHCNHSALVGSRRKIVYRRVLALLDREEHKTTRRLFTRSTLLRIFLGALGAEWIAQPKRWNALARIVLHMPHVLRRRWKHRAFRKTLPHYRAIRTSCAGPG